LGHAILDVQGLLTVCKTIKTIFIYAVFASMFISDGVHAVTLSELTAKIGSLNAQEKRDFLVKGAQKEGDGLLRNVAGQRI
jgi:hypothetical protein